MRIQPIATNETNIGTGERTNQQVSIPKPASVATSDVLELSATARTLTSLGPKGLQALQGLQEQGYQPTTILRWAGEETGNESFWERLSDLGDQLDSETLAVLGRRLPTLEAGTGPDYLDRIDTLFNLGHRNVEDIFTAADELSSEEFTLYTKTLSRLLEAGVVGTVTVDYRDQPVQVFLSNEIGSEYSRMPLYPKRFPF